MSNPFNGSKHGKSGGRFRPSRFNLKEREIDDRPSALRKGLPLRPTKPVDSIIVAESSAKHFEYTDIRETEETHVIPRKSLTEKQHLRLFPQQVELERIILKRRQLATIDGKQVMVKTTDTVYRTVWKSDKTLLRQNRPEQLDRIKFKRQNHYDKRTETQVERPAIVEIQVDPDNDLDSL